MNIIHKSAFAIVFTLLSISKVVAADKIGIVDIQAIFQSLPQAIAIQQTITEEFKDETDSVKRLEADLKFNMEKHKRDSATMSAQEIKNLEALIMQQRENYAEKAQRLQQAMQARFSEERNILMASIKQAVDAVAIKGDYDLLLNASSAAFAKDAKDVSQEVLNLLK